MTELAPIVLFVYKRPWHTEQTLSALKANDLADESVLYVYCDSPKLLASSEDVQKVEEVRRLVRSDKWCQEVHVIEASHNKGLVQSFVDGITEVVNKHGRVIVLEDDQGTSVGFLRYMNEALELYKDDEQVMHVSGYMWPAKFTSKDTTFFLQVQSVPGWGTWKRAWALYNHDADDHLEYFRRNPRLRRRFDIEGHGYSYMQLQKNAGGANYSWAVRWHASCMRAGGLSLFPARSLVQNLGIDGSGEHCGPTAAGLFRVDLVDYLPIRRIPVAEDIDVRKRVDEHYRRLRELLFAPRKRQGGDRRTRTVARIVRGILSLVKWAIARGSSLV